MSVAAVREDRLREGSRLGDGGNLRDGGRPLSQPPTSPRARGETRSWSAGHRPGRGDRPRRTCTCRGGSASRIYLDLHRDQSMLFVPLVGTTLGRGRGVRASAAQTRIDAGGRQHSEA
eukprot:2057446-Rhodomonas_salina.1